MARTAVGADTAGGAATHLRRLRSGRRTRRLGAGGGARPCRPRVVAPDDRPRPAPVDEPADAREGLFGELVGLPGDTARHRLETARTAAAVEGIEAHVRVLAGSVHFQVLELLRQVRPDLLVVGTRALRGVRRVVAPRLRRALLAAAPCPVMLVKPLLAPTASPWCCFAGGRRAREEATFTTARAFAAALGWRLVSCARPCREHRPGLVFVAGERFHALRSRLGASAVAALADTAPCPVVVLPPAARDTPVVRRRRPAPVVSIARSHMGRGHPRSLVWRVLTAYAVVLAAAMLVLIL